MTAIHYHSPPQRGAPDQHRELHLGTIRQADLRPEGEITDSQRRLYDKALLLLAVRTCDPAHINMHRLALMPHPIPIDRKPDEAFALAREIVKHDGVQ